jgi:hypothetical protein
MTDRLQQLLDELDPDRHDTLEIVDRLNRLGELSDDEAEQERIDILERTHALQELCGESHNEVLVIRDLDGLPAFIWQVDTRSQRYEAGPLYREHLSELELDALREEGGAEARRVLDIAELLPRAPRPVRRY